MELQGLSAACHPPSFLKGQLRVQGLGSLRGGHSHARPLPAPSQLDELSCRDCRGPAPARLAHGQGGQRRHLLTGQHGHWKRGCEYAWFFPLLFLLCVITLYLVKIISCEQLKRALSPFFLLWETAM